MDEELALPKVNPGLLRAADTMCARRLYAEFTGTLGFGSEDPVNRARVRDVLLDAVRVHHETGAFPAPPSLLEPEEQAVVAHALGWYAALFGGDTVVSVEVPLEQPTELPRRGVRLGGWADLGIVHADGHRELRQLVVRGGAMPPDPMEDMAVRLAVLRLVQARWITDGILTVTSADLVGGGLSRTTLGIPYDVGPIGDWLDHELATVRERIRTGDGAREGPRGEPPPSPGRDCGFCRFVVGCEAHGVKGKMWSRKGDLVASVLSLTPTSLDRWDRCPREWRAKDALGLPASDPYSPGPGSGDPGSGEDSVKRDDGASHGLFVHDLLRLIHQTGACQDANHVNDVLALHSSAARRSDPRAADEIRRHVERCPRGATSIGHEVDWVRASATPPVFVATARLDAVWEHDGLLDVRDYKTGAPSDYALSDDRRARLQAWVAAPQAAARGLRLRIRYEHLSADTSDPDPWEPDDGEIAAIEEELRTTVRAIRAEREFAGVHDADVCHRCQYRSICPDSASRGEPSWPVPMPAASTP